MIIGEDLINASSDDGDDLHSKNNEVKIYRQLYQTMYIVLTIEKILIIKNHVYLINTVVVFGEPPSNSLNSMDAIQDGYGASPLWPIFKETPSPEFFPK